MFGFASLVGLAGQAIGGIYSAVNNKRQQKASDAAAERQALHYEAEAAANPLERSENAALLNEYDRQTKKQVENARNIAAITGATPEYSVAVQEGVAQGRADMMGQMAAGASANADRNKAAAEAVREQHEQDNMQRLAARQQTYANLIGNAATAVGNIMDSYSAKPAPTSAPAAPNIPVAPQQSSAQQMGKMAQATSPNRVVTIPEVTPPKK